MADGQWMLASVPGREIEAADAVIRRIRPMIASESRLEEIRTAVTEACLNAMEHGNGFDPGKSVRIRLESNDARAIVRVSDQGNGWRGEMAGVLFDDAEDIWNKEHPRGWGLRFIQTFADAVSTGRDDYGFYVEMRFDY
jgi:anti-sigma regulatory factor (Ser/Thr protein kinase)